MKKQFLTFFVLACGAALAGCGGGGSANNTTPPVSTAQYAPIYTDKMNPVSPVPGIIIFQDIPAAVNAANNAAPGEGMTLMFSPRDVPLNSNFARSVQGDIIVKGAPVGNIVVTVRATALSLAVFSQNGTLYLAARCEKTDAPFCRRMDLGDNANKPDPRLFRWETGNYEVEDIFYFRRGLINNARRFGGFYINAEDKHVEYRWTPFSDILIDGGYRRFDNAAAFYAKIQADYNHFYFQYLLGNVRSDDYKNGQIDGFAFGWQKNGFAAKAEKPFGNGNDVALKLFYKHTW